MKIDTYALQQASGHHAGRQHEIRESFQRWGNEGNGRALVPTPRDPVQISDSGRELAASESGEMEELQGSSPTLNVLRRMLELMTGEKIKVFDAANFQASLSHTEGSEQTVSASLQAGGAGASYNYSETYREFESTQFSASGTVRTKDGKEISFSIEFEMTRVYEETSSFNLSIGAPPPVKDPLVINFDGNAADLTDQAFNFDLLSDGQQRKLPGLGHGSGFLAFDRNHDGRINDGRELFGPSSGNGFSELQALDDDGNGWIDEADAAYEQLSVWRPDEEGLASLRDRGIGAINLAPINTPFSVRDAFNQVLGEIRNTGLFLREDGGAGTIQQIDLKV